MTETATPVTFEAGYDELRRIVARLDADDVSVHEMCELFARGRGLEEALRGYLATQQGRLDEIEAGQNLPQFVVVAPGAPAGDAAPAQTRAAVQARAVPPAPAPAAAPAPAPSAPTESGSRIAFRAERLTRGSAVPAPGAPEHEGDLPF